MKTRNQFRVAIAIALATSSVAMAALNIEEPGQEQEPRTDSQAAPSFSMSFGLHLVLRDFSVQDRSGAKVFFRAGETVALSTSAGESVISFVPFEVEGPADSASQVRVPRTQIPVDALTFLESGDNDDLIARNIESRYQEARARRSQGATDPYQAYSGGSLFDGFISGDQASGQGTLSEQGHSRRYNKRGGRMVLTDSRGRFQARGCVAFVQSRVGWTGGPVGNGVGMVSALIRRMGWGSSDCAPAEGKVASWSGGHGGAGHTAIYNSGLGCWQYDSGCTGLQISGFRLRHCAHR